MNVACEGRSILRNSNFRKLKFTQPREDKWSLYVPPVQHSTILRSAHTVHLCVLCGSENKQRLFPYSTLTDWFV